MNASIHSQRLGILGENYLPKTRLVAHSLVYNDQFLSSVWTLRGFVLKTKRKIRGMFLLVFFGGYVRIWFLYLHSVSSYVTSCYASPSPLIGCVPSAWRRDFTQGAEHIVRHTVKQRAEQRSKISVTTKWEENPLSKNHEKKHFVLFLFFFVCSCFKQI